MLEIKHKREKTGKESETRGVNRCSSNGVREPKRRDLFRTNKKDPNEEEMIFQPLPNLSNARDDTQQQSPVVENLWKGCSTKWRCSRQKKSLPTEHLFISFHMRRCLRDIKYSVKSTDSLYVTLSGSRRRKMGEFYLIRV
ncbi:hypothetical protein CDAR_47681 [Caerostris darwini]|uniref:Uncharacterized protein n=1 Tax=Caerostris darwini TaxID=1538125 RepID=A0AAV4M937_9ARAC|nr:hypothetical protein CDAR_47681 [Caerostris darwini]